MELPRSGLVCICGESGCGKSSFLNAISCFVPYKGSIMVDGLELNSLSESESSNFRLKNIGFVFQDFKLFINQKLFFTKKCPWSVKPP